MSTPDRDAVPYTGPPSYGPPPQPGSGRPSAYGAPGQEPGSGRPSRHGWPVQEPGHPSAYGPPGPDQGHGRPSAYGPPPPWAAPQGWSPPPGWGPPGWGPPAWGPPGWGPPPGWGAPRGPVRPGTVIAASVLAFVSAVLVVLGTIYGLAFSALLSLARGPSAGVGTWTALAQLALVTLLVVGGLRQLNGDRRWLLAACAVQLALCLHWVLVLDDLASRTVGDALGFVPLLYLALAGAAAGLTFLPDARAWARRAGPPAPAGEERAAAAPRPGA